MEKQDIKTGFAIEHAFNNEYVRGRISGIAFMMFARKEPDSIGFAWLRHEDGYWEMTVRGTKKQYSSFRKLIEKLYPGLCEFDTRGVLKQRQ